MAYLVDFTIQQSTAGATSVAVTLPAHQVDDILVVFWTQDATSTVSMTGWTQIGTTQSPTGHTSAMFWRRATTTSETGTLTLGTADANVVRSFCIRDVDTTTAIDDSISTNSAAATASQFNSEQVTTTTTDCFILYCHSLEGVAVATHSDPGVHFIQSSDSLGTQANTAAASGSAWYIQRSVGAVPTPGWRCSLSGTRANFTIAFRNKSGGRIPAYIDDVSTPIAIVAGHHFSALNGISFATITLNNIGPGGTGKAATNDAAAAVADFGINPYSAALSSTPAITAATSVSGFQITLNPTVDLTNKFFVGYAIALNPRQGGFDHGSVAEGGTFMAFASGTTANTDYRSYQVLARDARVNTIGRGVFSVNPNQTTTAFGTNGSYDPSITSRLLFLSNNPTAAITLYTSDWCAVEKLVVAGGDANFPVDSTGVAEVGSSFRIPVVDLTGTSGLLSLVPLQIGGADAVNFAIDGGSLQFPRIYDTAEKEINYHAVTNGTGISYAGKSGDSIKHTNSVVTSASPYYWEINSAATSASSWDFTGLTVVGANVTLRPVTTFDSMTFSECVTMNATASSVTNSSVSLESTTNNPLTVTSTTSFSNCEFNTTLISAGIGMVTLTTTTGVPFSNCTFMGSTTTGHAIIITVPGTYSFSNLTFTGYGGTPGDNSTPNSGSTSAAIYNNSGGAVIIQSSGGNQPSVRNGAGATTDVQTSANVTISGLVADSEVRAYTGTNPATAVEIAGTESSTGTSFTFTQSVSGVAGYIQIFHVEYQPIFLSYTYLGVNDTITVQQIKDRQYARGSTFTPT